MLQKAAISLSWQVELLPGLVLKQAIVCVAMNHPSTFRNTGMLCHVNRGCRKETRGVSATGCAKWSGARRPLIMQRSRLLRGLCQCADQLHGARTKDFGSNPHHRPACCGIPCGGSGKGGWQDPHSCLVPPPARLCTPTASFALPLQEGSL